MAACHQCSADVNAPRTGNCSICTTADAPFCARCATWELGPLSAPAGLPAAFRGHEEPVVAIKTCPIQTQARLKEVRTLAANCRLINSQKDSADLIYPGGTFSAWADDAVAVYDQIYAASGLDRDMMHVLILAQLSAHALAVAHRKTTDALQDAIDTKVSKLETEKNAEKNKLRELHTQMGTEMTEVESTKGDKREAAQQKVRDTLTRIALREKEMENISTKITQARANHVYRIIHRHDAPRIAAKHAAHCFADHIPDNERALALKAVASEVVEMVLRKKMSLGMARERLLAEGANPAGAKKILLISMALYHARTASWTPDGNQNGGFDSRRAPGYMNAAHRADLFGDNPASPPVLTDACKTTLGTLYASLDVDLAGGVRFPDQDVANALQANEINAVQANYLQSMPRMDHANDNERSACEKKVRALVLARLAPLIGKNENQTEPVLNEILTEMRTGFDLCTSAFDPPLEAYANAPDAAEIQSASVRASGTVQWNEALPCTGVTGHYTGSRFDMTHHRAQGDGRQEAWHYFDWRNDKDRALYDFFPFEIPDRPIFVSLSMAEDHPEVDTRYGHHTYIWKSSLMRRSALTCGDKGNPRRSMLLLLRDFLYPIPLKDGSPANGKLDRVLTLANIYQRTIGKATRSPIDQNSFNLLIAGPKTEMSVSANIEAHVFGPVKMKTHSKAIILVDGATRNRVLLADAQHPWTEIHYPVGGIAARQTTRPALIAGQGVQATKADIVQ